jgi:hypothetical protein
MEFSTPVEIYEFTKKLTYDDSIILLGSCFTESIGNKFSERKFLTDINPFGIIYNPISLLNCIELLESNKIFTQHDLFEENGIWKSFYHHSRFSHSDINTTLNNINERISVSSEFIRKTSFLFLTIGTAWVFEHQKSGKIVSNCHKSPVSNFNHRLLSVDETYDALKSIVEKTKKNNPSCTVIFTISPVRHLKNGTHGNQLSKAILLTAFQKLQEIYSEVQYFPAYEIQLDELRDYRFYADDMIHPSSLAIDYIWEKLCLAFLHKETFKTMKEIENINKAVQHRSFFPNTKTHQEFLKSLSLKICEIENKHPTLHFQKEKEFILNIH